MSAPEGMTSGQLSASGALDSNVHSSQGVPSQMPDGEDNMLPLGKAAILQSLGSNGIDSVIKVGKSSLESAFSAVMPSGSASALGSSISDCMGKISNYMGASEAKGDALGLENLGPGEITNHGIPGVAGDLQLKDLTFKGNQGAEH
jgi:hypothetical protein